MLRMANCARPAWAVLGLCLLCLASGCVQVGGKTTGTPRTGTEQLLLTGTVDRAVACIRFEPLAGTRVFLDEKRVTAVDKDWLVFALRRAMAEQGLLLVDKAEDAQVIVEAGVAAYATDDRDLSISLPGVGLAGAIPVPLAGIGTGGQTLSSKGRHFAVTKLALFGYDAQSRHLVWESGTILNDEHVARHSILGTQVKRESSLPELERYPPRRSWLGRLRGRQ